MRQAFVRLFGSVVALVIALLPERARAGNSLAPQPTNGNSQVVFVPWKVLNPGGEAVSGMLVLHWIPATRDEIRRSPLLTSRPLAIYASQCVGMQLVRPDDDETIERLGAEELPAIVLTDEDGTVIERLDDDVRVAAVEKLVREEIEARAALADQMLDEARSKASAGEREVAIALYREVCELRCAFPRKAKDAERALRKLGVF